jgi:excisionase family DNA binding protein
MPKAKAVPPAGAHERLLHTPVQAAELLSIGRTTVHNLMASGELRSIKIGKSRRVPHDALEEFLRKRSAA